MILTAPKRALLIDELFTAMGKEAKPYDLNATLAVYTMAKSQYRPKSDFYELGTINLWTGKFHQTLLNVLARDSIISVKKLNTTEVHNFYKSDHLGYRALVSVIFWKDIFVATGIALNINMDEVMLSITSAGIEKLKE